MEAAPRFAAWVMEEEGKNVYLAASADKSIAKFRKTPKDLDWWAVNMEVFMQPAEACYVLGLEGWEDSKGVAVEMDCAKRLGKPVVVYVEDGEGFKKV